VPPLPNPFSRLGGLVLSTSPSHGQPSGPSTPSVAATYSSSLSQTCVGPSSPPASATGFQNPQMPIWASSLSSFICFVPSTLPAKVPSHLPTQPKSSLFPTVKSVCPGPSQQTISGPACCPSHSSVSYALLNPRVHLASTPASTSSPSG